MKGFILQKLGALAAIAVVAFALLAQRCIERGESAMGESDRALDAGRLELAVLHARRAAAAYVPGAQHVARGYERLRAVARGAERERDLELARKAWGAARAAAVESRHLWQPNRQVLAEADAELARLTGGAPASRAWRLAGSPGVLLGALVLGAAAAVLGWGAWCNADQNEVHERPRARLAALACLLGVLVWGAALLSA